MSHRLNSMIRTAVVVFLPACFTAPAWADMSMEERFKVMESRMDSLERENRILKGQLKQAEQKVAATGAQIEKIVSIGGSSKVAWAEKTSFGGYGELHLNKLKNKKTGGANKDEVDFHRFVLFMGHEFNDRVRFFSELEVEHALAKDTQSGTASTGLVGLEQAYLDFTLNDSLSAKAGLLLMPVGIISETHEPPTFYGVERNPVETNIIPTTWREGGVSLSARMGNGFAMDGAITSGLKTTVGKNYAVRDGRQHVANAPAKDPAYTARMKWAGIPGIELAGTVQYQSDVTQSADATAGAARLYEAHAVVNKGPFGLRALYAGWNLDGSGPKAVGADKQNGWYMEPAWKFSEQWGVFARHSRWDNQAGDATDSQYRQMDVGVNYWPHPDVVVKLDFQNQQSPAGKDEYDGFNLGVGYQF
ncbi:MAG: porin [Gallionella sp.]|nr:porin [Gallionella sp.]